MPRVALLVNFVAPYQLALYEALQARVGELKIFVSTPMEPNRKWRVDWGGLDVTVQRHVTVRKHWRHSAGFTDTGYVHFPYDTLAQLRRFRPDAIISSELGLRTALAATYRLCHRRVTLAMWATLSEHTEVNRGRLRDMVRPRLLRCADVVFVNGASGARYVTGMGVSMDRVVYAPYTPELGPFRAVVRPARTTDAVRLLYAGLFVERKGLLPFLEVLRTWAVANPARRIEFTIAGDGPLRPALETFAVPSSVALTVMKPVAYDQLPALYATADLFVLPTLADEWAVVVNEAMAAGVPVLGSLSSQAVEELVVDGETGWSFTPHDVPSITRALDKALCSTGDQWSRMGADARRRVFQTTPGLVADRITETLCLPPQSC